ncbi:MAG: hypothetical protein HY063_09930 [Bacteroidetes bacterium]|nr:hypothetical protein [Bacteroidota bacterium]
MTKQDFIQYLSHPENLNGHSISALEKLVEEYPYFQTGRMLHLKNLHNQNSIDYEKNLHITSAYAPGGKVLYNLIKKKREEKLEVRSEKLEVAQPINEIFPKLEPIAVLQEMPMGKDSSAPLGMTTAKKDEYDELQLHEKEMLREAYRTSMTVDLLQEEKFQEIQTPKTENRKLETYSFNDWLKVVSGKNPESSAEEKTVQKKQQSELVDKFILEETSKAIAKPKVEFYSAEAMAKKSISDDETFVSETLAGIYLRQGNLPKALRAYEILMVKHPEKIHIFAPLLEKIKKLLQDQRGK